MIHVTSNMSHYLRRVFSKAKNVHKLHRTVSGLDKDHIKTGNYIYQNFKKNHLPEIAESLRLLNIFGPGSMHRKHIEKGNYVKNATLEEIAESLRLLNIFGPGSMHRHKNHNFVDIWSGGVWGGF